MRKNAQTLLKLFRDHKEPLRFSFILKAGFHPDTIESLVSSRVIEKIGRGLYGLAGRSMGAYPDLVAAAVQVPRGVICLISALAFHEATGEIPKKIEMAIPRPAHANRIQYPPVKFYHFSPSAWKAGLEVRSVDGFKIRVYDLAKTVADCFKFRNRIGMNVAREALKIAITEKGVDPNDVMRYAKLCRVDKILKPVLEAML